MISLAVFLLMTVSTRAEELSRSSLAINTDYTFIRKVFSLKFMLINSVESFGIYCMEGIKHKGMGRYRK